MLNLFVLMLGLLGCGGADDPFSRAAVRGTVTLDGKPLEEGTVRFVPVKDTKGPMASVRVENGRFEAAEEFGPIVGTHRIEIVSTDDGGYALDDETAVERLKAQNVRRIDAVRVPAIYNSRSTLTEDVTAEGPNEFAFNLTTPRRRY